MTTIDLRQLSVLVVDPSDNMRRIIRSLLLGFGVRAVSEASDAATARELTGRAMPDIVMVELRLPDEGGGLALIRHLRDVEASCNAEVPIIAMNADTQREDVLAARDAGATEFLCKPASGKAIHDRIANILLNPRPFVRTKSFFGPDRRRFVHPNFGTEERRVESIGQEFIENAAVMVERLAR